MRDGEHCRRHQGIIDRRDSHGIFATVRIAELTFPKVSVVRLVREGAYLVIDVLIRIVVAHYDSIRAIRIVFVDDKLFVRTTIHIIYMD